VTEDFIPLDNKRGGNQRYEQFVNLTDSGYMALTKKENDQDRTDIFKLYLTRDKGWQSIFLFSLPRGVKIMRIINNLVFLDKDVYNMDGSFF
jgi:hypothetical protein